MEGIIQDVDAVNRDMTVLTAGQQKLVDVPPACPIVLNGETVKLRLLQPGDQVHIVYRNRNNRRAAQRIEAGVNQAPLRGGVLLPDQWKGRP